MDPTAVSIKIVYTFGVTESELVVLSKTIDTDVEKRLFDYVYASIVDKVDAVKNNGIIKIILNTIS